MRLWSFRLIVVASLAVGAGCTTIRPGSRVAGLLGNPADTADSEPPAAATRRVGKPSPDARTADEAAREELPRNLVTRGNAAPALDPGTLRLIEQELSDASPDERETLLAAFRGLPPESVERILQARRMQLDATRRGREASAPSVARQPVTETGRVTPASAVAPQVASRTRPAASGLGSVDAWSKQPQFRQPAAAPIVTAGIGGPTDSPVAAADSAAPAGQIEFAHATLTTRPRIEIEDVWPLRVPAATREAAPLRTEERTSPVSTPSTPAVATQAVATQAVATQAVAAPAVAAPAVTAPAAAPVQDAAVAQGAAPGTASAQPPTPAVPPDATPPRNENFVSLAAARTVAMARSIVNQAASVAPGTARAADTPNAAKEPAAVATPATVPPVVESPDRLTALIAAVEGEVAQLQPGDNENDRRIYIERHVHLRMLYLVAGQHERALQAIPAIDPVEQEFWQQTFWGITNYFDAVSIPAASDRASQAVSQFSSAILRLQQRAHLELRNVTFCHKIASFGNFEKYARDEFSPGQEVLLYAEVGNIHSDPTSDGKFRTSLKSTIEIYRHGPQGELVDQIDLPETIDVCGTHRRDYFHSYQFAIPGKLGLGPHVLKLKVEDQLGKRVALYSLNFMVK